MTDLTLSEALARFAGNAGNVYDPAALQNNVPRFRGWFDLETGAYVLAVDIVGDPRLPFLAALLRKHLGLPELPEAR